MSNLTLIFAVLAVLVAMAGLRKRREVREDTEEGRLDEPWERDDEPLDMDEIQREERRFWEESSWDEPEEF